MFGMFGQGFWYGSSLAASGKLSAGEVLRTFWACLIAAQSIELGLPQSIVLEKGKVAATGLREALFFQRPSKSADEMKDVSYPRYCEGDIEVSNVSYFHLTFGLLKHSESLTPSSRCLLHMHPSPKDQS